MTAGILRASLALAHFRNLKEKTYYRAPNVGRMYPTRTSANTRLHPLRGRSPKMGTIGERGESFVRDRGEIPPRHRAPRL